MHGSLTVKAAELAAAVKYCSRWLAARPAIPAHAGLLFEVDGDRLHVFGFDPDGGTGRATVEIGADDEPRGSFLVAGRLADALVGTFPKTATVTITQHDSAVLITAGRTEVTLPTMPENDYPALPGVAPAIGEIDGRALADAVRRVGVAASRDLTKQIEMCGMAVQFGEGDMMDPVTGAVAAMSTVTLTATDKYRIARVVLPWRPAPPDSEDDAIAPVLPLASILMDAADAFAESDDVVIGTDGHVVSFSTPTRSLVVRLLDFGRFPPVGDFFTKYTAPASVEFAVPDFTMPIKRAEMMNSGKDVAHVTIGLTAGLATVGGGMGSETGSSGDEVDVDYAGPDSSLLFKAAPLRDALNSAPVSRVRMHFTPGKTLPAVLTCDDDPTWTHFVMPLTKLS